MAGGDQGPRLAVIRLLRGLPAPALERLAQRCRWRHYDSGEQILDRESDSRDVFFVVEGEAVVINYSLSGREVAYGRIGAGGFFGELAAIDGRPRSASVVAGRACLLASLPPEAFNDLTLEHPVVAQRVLRRLAHIIRTADDRIMDLSTLSAVQRVYAELIRMAEEARASGGQWTIRPLPTQRDIARHASTSRETVARVLSKLTHAGIVKRRRRTLVILDRDRLAELAETEIPSGV